MAASNIPFAEQSPRSNTRGVRDYLRHLWGQSQQSLMMHGASLRKKAPGSVVSEEMASAPMAEEKRSTTIAMFEDFRIEARAALSGWRIASIDRETGIQHDFYVQQGEIYHLSLWKHTDQFMVGRPVNQIRDSEKQAILQVVSELISEKS
jgi:hypothetical protein